MKSKLKRLALVLASAVLFSLVLTSCGGGGGTGGNGGNGGNGGSGSIVTPGDDGANYEASEDGTQVIETDENGEIVSVTNIEADELSGDRTLTRTYSILPEKVQLQGCVLVQETVTTNAEGNVTKVVRRYAIAVGELAKTNGTVALLAEIVLPDEKMDDTVYITVTSEYEDGSLVKTTVEYEDEEGQLYKVQYDVGDEGDLELTGSGDDESVVAPILALLGDNEDVKQTVQDISEDAKDSADELVKNVDKALEEQGKTEPDPAPNPNPDPDPDPEPTPTPEVPTEKVYGVEDFKLTLKGENQSRPDMAELYVSGEIVEAVTEGKIVTEVTAQAELIYDEETGKLCQAEAEVPTEIVEAFPSAEGAVIIADFDCSAEGTVGITVHVEKNGAQVGESYSGSITHDGKHLTGASLVLGDGQVIVIEVTYDGNVISAIYLEEIGQGTITCDFSYVDSKLTEIDIAIFSFDDGETIYFYVDISYEGDFVSGATIQLPREDAGTIEFKHIGDILTEVFAFGILDGESAEMILHYNETGAFHDIDLKKGKREVSVDASGNYTEAQTIKISQKQMITVETVILEGDIGSVAFKVDGVEVTDEKTYTVPAQTVILNIDDSGVYYGVEGEDTQYVEWYTWESWPDEQYAYLHAIGSELVDVSIQKVVDEEGKISLLPDIGTIEKTTDGTWILYIDEQIVRIYCETFQEDDGQESYPELQVGNRGFFVYDGMLDKYTRGLPLIFRLVDIAAPRLSEMFVKGFVLS